MHIGRNENFKMLALLEAAERMWKLASPKLGASIACQIINRMTR